MRPCSGWISQEENGNWSGRKVIRTGFLPRDFPGKPRGGGGHAQLLTGVEEEAKGGSSVLWGQMDGRKWFHQGAGRVKAARVCTASTPLQHG